MTRVGEAPAFLECMDSRPRSARTCLRGNDEGGRDARVPEGRAVPRRPKALDVQADETPPSVRTRRSRAVQGRGTMRVGTRERLSTLFATPPRKVWLSPFSCAPITMRSHPSLTEVLRISSAG